MPPSSDPRSMRRAGAIRAPKSRGWTLPPEALPISAGVWGLGLLIGWLLQMATPFCDHHPGAAAWIAGCNLVAAIALATIATLRRSQQDLALGALGLTLVGALFVWWAGADFQTTLDGTPGYTLPHRPTRFDPTAKDVSLMASDGVALKATFLGHGKGQGIILLPGWASTRHGFAIASLAQWLSARFDVLVLDPRGQGESDGEHSPDLKDKLDMLAAIAYLNGRGDQQIGVLAEREAALSAIAAMSDQHNIKSLALAGPVGHWGEQPAGASWLRDPSNWLGSLYWRIGAGLRTSGGHGHETAELLPKAGGAPILLMGSREDPQGLLRQLHLIAPEPRSLRLFMAPGQPVAWSAYQEYYQTVAQWFGLTLSEAESKATVEATPPAATESVPAMPVGIPVATADPAIAAPAEAVATP